jgi:DNA-binding PucR family transcriptional regulator
VRSDAALQVIELGILEVDGPVTTIVASLLPLPPGGLSDTLRVAVDEALSRVRWRLMSKQTLHLVRPDHVVLLVSHAEPWVRKHGATALASRVRSEVQAVLPSVPDIRRAAVAGPAKVLAEARTSYKQAQQALRVTAAVGNQFGDVVSWEELGIYKLLVELPIDQLGDDAIHPAVKRLMAQPSTEFLLRTLEVYLDLAGDAQATAAALHVHRTTLHHRLRRVQEVAQFDLRNGDERLALHLSLKIAHLQGHRWHDVPSSDAESSLED